MVMGEGTRVAIALARWADTKGIPIEYFGGYCTGITI